MTSNNPFVQAYGVGAEQENVYHGTATALVDAVLQGYNGTMMPGPKIAASHPLCGGTLTSQLALANLVHT